MSAKNHDWMASLTQRGHCRWKAQLLLARALAVSGAFRFDRLPALSVCLSVCLPCLTLTIIVQSRPSSQSVAQSTSRPPPFPCPDKHLSQLSSRIAPDVCPGLLSSKGKTSIYSCRTFLALAGLRLATLPSPIRASPVASKLRSIQSVHRRPPSPSHFSLSRLVSHHIAPTRQAVHAKSPCASFPSSILGYVNERVSRL